MCGKGACITTTAQWKGKSLGVTDIGSGTDSLTLYLAARNHLTTKDISRVAVGAGPTFVAAIQHNRFDRLCHVGPDSEGLTFFVRVH